MLLGLFSNRRDGLFNKSQRLNHTFIYYTFLTGKIVSIRLDPKEPQAQGLKAEELTAKDMCYNKSYLKEMFLVVYRCTVN